MSRRRTICAALLGLALVGEARGETIQPGAAVPVADRACARDTDCVLLPAVCAACPPCAPTWRAVGNRKAAAVRERQRQVVSCPSFKCARCASEKNWRGSKPVCIKGQCALERPPDPDRTCAKNSDCVFEPSRPCSCPPCGETWRRAINVKRAASIRREDATRRCLRPKCARCAKPLRWLGTDAVCMSGECASRGGLVIMRAP